jgi:Tfp pilus assembly protein PilF
VRKGVRALDCRGALVAAALILLTAAIFAPLRGAPFLEMDDGQYVFENGVVRQGLSWTTLRWAFTSTEASNWHPVTWVSHLLDVRLFGLDAGAHHLVNVGLHAANAVLLFALLARLAGAVWPAALTAALFAVHPLHVESVAWIAERKDVLSAFFGLLTLAAYLRYLRRPGTGRFLSVLLLYALGLMAKPMLVSLPLLLLLLDYWPLGRWPGSAPSAGAPGRPRLAAAWPLLREKLPLAALAAASSALTVLAQSRGGSVISLAARPLAQRAGNAVVSLADYLSLTAWPAGLAVYYPHPGAGLPSWKIGLSLGFVALVTALAVAARRRLPYLAVGWGWYLVTLLPVIGLVQVGDQAMADRYTYLPLIGVFTAVAWGGASLARHTAARTALAALGIAAVLACGVAARGEAVRWRDGYTLFSRALAVTRDNWAAHNVLGGILSGRGDAAGAEEHYREVVRIRPTFPEGHNNLATVLAGQGRVDEAFPHYREAIRLNPRYAEPWFNMGLDLAGRGATADAAGALEEAIRRRPAYPKAWYLLGVQKERLGRTAEAAVCYRQALRYQPGMPAAVARLSGLSR